MPITFDCEACGQSYTVTDASAGKVGKCKQCGHAMAVPDPSPSTSGDYGLGPVVLEPVSGPRWARGPEQPDAPRPSPHDDPELEPLDGYPISRKRVIQGLLTVFLVIAAIMLRVAKFERSQRNQARAPALAPAPAKPMPDAARLAAAQSGPIRLPDFPDLSFKRPEEVEPGILRRQITLGWHDPDGRPGCSGNLWLYLPAGNHADHSLPCILITGAGSNLLSGMDLAPGALDQHVPYVRAGYAVLAFELDGRLPDREQPSDPEVLASMSRFLMARAGLVNAHVAIEFLLARVPQVDPARLIAAGHSSAGTLALLFAEHEPRISRCIAYAPATDIDAHLRQFNPGAVEMVQQVGFGALITDYSPRALESKLDRPLFLFNSRQDPIGWEAEQMAARLKAAGKPVTLMTVPTGDHYHSMIEQGIPAAIEWLKAQDAKE